MPVCEIVGGEFVQRKSFKQRLEDNPFEAASTVAVASGAVVASVVWTLFGHQLEFTKQEYEHQLEIRKEQYQTELSQLNELFNSLERRIGKDGEERFIDIGKMQMLCPEVDRLDTSYSPYMNGDFYISVPRDDN